MNNSSPSYAVRPAEKKDINTLQAIEEISFSSDRLSKRAMVNHVTNKNAVFYVLTDKENPVGYILFFIRAKKTARLYSFVLAPEYRGRGLSHIMYGTVEKKLSDRKVERLILEVDENDPKTIFLYSRWGYAESERLKRYYKDGRNAIRMKKELKNG